MAKVGILSKPEHAKPHAKALEEDGHDVVLLGARVSEIPDTLDALVVRVASCSHGATEIAFSARRNGDLPVIFANSVTQIRERIRQEFSPTTPRGGDQPEDVNPIVTYASNQQHDTEQNTKRGNMPQKKVEEIRPHPADRSPIAGTYYRGYYHSSSRLWQIRGGQNFNTHVCKAVGRGAAEARIAELDVEYAAQLEAQAAETAATPVAVESVPAPVVEPKIELPKRPIVELVSTMPTEPTAARLDPASTQTATLPEDFKAAIDVIRQYLVRNNLEESGSNGVVVQLTYLHLFWGKGAACQREGAKSHMTRDITQVSCPDCRASASYKAAEFALAHLSIGD
jgi:hypothetical protein